MIGAGRRAWASTAGSRVETTLDPAAQPFLDDHRIDGTPVLPGVMGIEAFAEVAALLAARLARGAGRGRRVPGAVQVLPGRAAHACSSRRVLRADGDGLVADCRLARQPDACRARPSRR